LNTVRLSFCVIEESTENLFQEVAMLVLRPMTEADYPAIVNILNEVVRTGNQIAFTEEFTVADRAAWFAEHQSPDYPLYVAEIEDAVVGWVSLSAYRPGREALKHTVEISYGVYECMRRKGVGSAMVLKMLEVARERGHRIVFAIIFDNNTASLGLLEKHGFVKWGHLPDVALLNGTLLGHVYVGMKLDSHSPR
jgi:L-amino acid N-acyltransferase YncA